MTHTTFNSFEKISDGEILPHHTKAIYDPYGRGYVIGHDGGIIWSTSALVKSDACWSGAFAFKAEHRS